MQTHGNRQKDWRPEITRRVVAGGGRGGFAIEGREGFAARLDRIEADGVRTVIVEDRRFARDLVVCERARRAL